jgi:hypothetical protein
LVILIFKRQADPVIVLELARGQEEPSNRPQTSLMKRPRPVSCLNIESARPPKRSFEAS